MFLLASCLVANKCRAFYTASWLSFLPPSLAIYRIISAIYPEPFGQHYNSTSTFWKLHIEKANSPTIYQHFVNVTAVVFVKVSHQLLLEGNLSLPLRLYLVVPSWYHWTCPFTTLRSDLSRVILSGCSSCKKDVWRVYLVYNWRSFCSTIRQLFMTIVLFVLCQRLWLRV